MTTKEVKTYLSQYRRIVLQIADIKQQLNNLPTVDYCPLPSGAMELCGDRRTNRTTDPVGRLAIAVADACMRRRKQLEGGLEKLQSEKQGIEACINTLKDRRHRDVLVYRYLRGMKRYQTAAAMNYSETQISRMTQIALKMVHSFVVCEL